MVNAANKPVLKVRDLRKTYGSFAAVDGVSFQVGRGEIVGLLGPNGAGKTSTINMILGLLTPTSGSIRIFGLPYERRRSDVAERMNFDASYSYLPGNLSVRENLFIFSLLYGVRHARQKIEETLRLFDLERLAPMRTGFLSSGEQSRLGMAKALLNDPELLLLDEPTGSLDPATARDVRGLIRTHAADRGMAVLWTSHDMHEIAAVCDRVLFLAKGKILLEGNPKTLPAEHGKRDLEELFITIAREPLSLNHS